MSTKSILFNTEMVRAILDDRKTVARRVAEGYALDHLELDTDGSIIGVYNQDEGRVFPVMDYAPYRPGDILYVRETFCLNNFGYHYRADWLNDDCPDMSADDKWRPSIHMPREAARIFLRVTDVRVERLQDITEEQAEKEGCTAHGGNLALDEFEEVWHRTLKPADRALYGWEANPWVWVIEFERCEKPEGD